MEKIGLREAARQVAVPYTTCARWIQSGLIRPRGYNRTQAVKVRLSRKEVRELKTLANLRGILSMQQLKKALRYLRKDLKQNPLSMGRFFVVGGTAKRRQIVKICNTGEALELIGEGKGRMMIPLVFNKIEISKEVR